MKHYQLSFAPRVFITITHVCLPLPVLFLVLWGTNNKGVAQELPANTYKNPTEILSKGDSLRFKMRIESAIDSIFARWNKKNCPGCILGLEIGDKRLIIKGYGMANLEHEIPLLPETISESGSVAKQFTSAAVVLLSNNGKIHLDSTLSRYLPDLPWWGKKITVRQLMNHTSGIRDIHSLFSARGEASYSSDFSNEDALHLIKQQQTLNFEPGAEYLYSNSGYTLLPFLVERVSGQSFVQFCRDSLFQPLGLRNTSWRNDFRAIVKRRAVAYDQGNDAQFLSNMPFSSIFGSGGLLTTVGDLLLWNRNFERNDSKWRSVFDILRRPSRFNDGRLHNYGLGLSIGKYNGMEELAHSGATAGYRTFLAYYPEQKVSIALLCNLSSVNPAALTHQTMDVLCDNLIKTTSNSTTTSTIQLAEKYSGLYKQNNNEFLLRIVRKGKTFYVQNPANPSSQSLALPLSSESFRVGNTLYLCREDMNSGGITLIQRNMNDSTQKLPVYQKVKEFQSDSKMLKQYVGHYHSPELTFTHSIILENDSLFLQIRAPHKKKLTPTYNDAFMNEESGYIKFYRDAQGNILGYGLTSGRAWNLRFSKVQEINK